MQPTLTPPPWSGAAFAERGNGLEITCVTFVSVGSGGRLVSVGWAQYSNNRSSHEEIQAVIDTLDADVDRPCTLSLDAGSVNAPPAPTPTRPGALPARHRPDRICQ